MTQGPLGAPRPAASSTLSMVVEVNKPDREIDSEELAVDIASIEQLFNRLDELSIDEKTEQIGDDVFEVIEVSIIFRGNDVRLASLNSIVEEIEEVIGASRVGVRIEAT